MRALYLSDRRVELRRVEAPRLAEGEAIVRTRLAGVCDTDLQLRAGYMGFSGIPGHEFVGEIEDCADASRLGQRVVGEINAGCGACERCRGGLERHCAARTVLGILGRPGAHAERFLLPARNLLPVPDAVADEAAVFAEPLAAACEILEQVHLGPADKVAVIGDGKLGLLIAQVLAGTGAELLLVGRHARKLAIVEARGIATRKVAAGQGCADLDQWADAVVECTGSPSGFAAARRMLRPRGTFILKSTYAGSLELDLSSLVVDEISLVGSRCGRFGAALRLLERGAVDTAALIDGEAGLGEGAAAYDRAGRRGALKVLIRPD